MAQSDKTIIDLTGEPGFEYQKFPSFQEIPSPFLNSDSDLGQEYYFRSRIKYKLNKIKMLINEMEHDLAIGIVGRSTTNE